ncbi:MAG: DUF423 domain-containing protein [Cyclobacteriaceae bacterium]
MTNQEKIVITGVVFGGLGVAIGAFGAHALKPILIENARADTFELGVRYQFYHALALIAIGALLPKFESKKLRYGATCISLGVIIFSGSLYILSLSNIAILGAITPIGGVFLIIGWILFLFSILENKKLS